MITEQIWKVDIAEDMSYHYLRCKQYDNLSRKYRIFITNRRIPVDLTGNEIITMQMWHPNESKPYISKVLDWEGNMPVITLTSGMLSKAGDIDVDFMIYSPEQKSTLSTGTQHISVQKSLLNYSGLITSEEFGILEHLIEEAIQITELLEDFQTDKAEIERFITRITKDISDYSTEHAELVAKYTDLSETLIAKINEDIAHYMESFHQFETGITSLQTAVEQWYTAAQNAENTRIQNEAARIQQEISRQESSSAAVTLCEASAFAASSSGEYANIQGLFAQTQANRVDDLIKDLEITRNTIDGGSLSGTEDPESSICDGGRL